MNVIVNCADCKTKFRVTEQTLGALGRKVRCSVCQFVWFQLPPIEQDSPEPTPTLSPSTMKLDIPTPILDSSEEVYPQRWFLKAVVFSTFLVLFYLTAVLFKNDILELFFMILNYFTTK